MRSLLTIILFFPCFLRAQSPRILVNQVGYEQTKAKRAIIQTNTRESIASFKLIDDSTGKLVYTGKPVYSGPVAKWKNWQYYTVDFSTIKKPGVYRVTATIAGQAVTSYPFAIGRNVLEKFTLSDILYYFKGQRSAGLIDQADSHLPLPAAAHNPAAPTKDTLDLHGGWYDATGDYGIHLSHLSFSSYFNPQQVPMVLYSLLKTQELLTNRTGTDYRQFLRRIADEANYGADYLVRLQAPGGSFYRSIGAPGAAKAAKDRVISPEQKSYRIKVSKDSSWGGENNADTWRSYQSSFRSGGGMAIAALAMASMTGIPGEFSNARYLKSAEDAFAFLDSNNASMTNDGKENIVDDYCALAAATELYKATRADKYREAAEKRANRLTSRLTSWNKYTGYWRADNVDRPFFHPSDAGLPVVSLLYYYPYATGATQTAIKAAVHRSLEHELAITHEVNNPFGYSRQLVQDTLGHRRSSFFFPHGSEASPWWQGEDARLGSMAAAARLAIPLFAGDPRLVDSLETFSLDQLNWILGLNPYNASMLQGTGHNNPAYAFFGTFEYTNAPGGIVNGITSGLGNEDDIDFNLSYAMTGKDNDWRWAEQWLPHDAWYLLAIAAGQPLQRLATTIDAEHINDHPTLAIGAPAPDFNLPATDGKNYTLKDFNDAKVLLVVFMCNHCPTSQAYERRLVNLVNDYAAKDLRVVAISPNAPAALRIDELGYSDVGDGFDDMKKRAKDAAYNFPYLYDGETETASKQYGPISTPHIFIFDQQRRLRYNGRFDDQENPAKTPHSFDARNAIDALLAGKEPPVAVTKTFGCSIKWIEKSNWTEKAAITWAHEPVHLDTIGNAGIKNLVSNNTKKLRLINLWATWCTPCVQEYPQLVTLNRMYRDRGFELVSISTDDSAARPKALKFLQGQECSSPNYIYSGDDKYKLMETIDPKWQGALPYSLLVEPGGKIIYAKQGAIDPGQLRKLIFDSPYMGRLFKQ
ncbi:MAG TPA: redoxin domain-containing protein [Puia sp.]|uniref:redoxin domain-containing protein n=1 Tax=Puia sp. TaxID=2045100 RepID=UPI002B52EC58|nr:redoxin domain-containing protein [Puia sp.]HVU99471.1 redoxin domain-containing protein [Puia sp.]